MTRYELISKLTNLSGIKRKDVSFIVDNLLDLIVRSADKNEKVTLRNFGTFYRSEKKQRKVYSPIAGKEVEIPAETVLNFKASKNTKKKI